VNRANEASPPGFWLEVFAVDFGGALQLHEHLKLHHVTLAMQDACLLH